MVKNTFLFFIWFKEFVESQSFRNRDVVIVIKSLFWVLFGTNNREEKVNISNC